MVQIRLCTPRRYVEALTAGRGIGDGIKLRGGQTAIAWALNPTWWVSLSEEARYPERRGPCEDTVTQGQFPVRTEAETAVV